MNHPHRKQFSGIFAAGLLVASWLGATTPTIAATVQSVIGGTMSNSDNGCLNIIPLLSGEDCSYANTRYPAAGGWQGPIYMASYYPPGYFASNSADGYTPTAGDGKFNMSLSGTFAVDDNGTPADGTDDRISGNFSFGAADHWVNTGQGDQALERWTAWNHTLAATTVNFATARPGGGFEYVIGIRGKPTPAPLFLAADPTQVFGSEAAPAALTPNPWNTAGAAQALGQRIGIERSVGFGNVDNYGTNLQPNAGATTSATLSGYECFDADNDCTASHLMIGTSTVPGSVVALPPGFTNLVLVVTTGADGRITTGEGYWTREYILTAGPPIGNDPSGSPTTPNSWSGGRFTFAACIDGQLPVAEDDAFAVNEGAVNAQLAVLANDTLSCDGEPTITIVTPPAHGTAVATATGIKYTPQQDPADYYDGPDSLTYTVTDADENVSEVATVTITVSVVAPEAVSTEAYVFGANPVTRNVLSIAVPGNGSLAQHTVIPGAGTLGTCTASGANLTFAPTPGGGSGPGGCSFAISDAEGDIGNTATFLVWVYFNDPPANPDQATTSINTPVNIDVMANDYGFYDPVTVGLYRVPLHGTVTIAGSPGPRSGIVVTYTPNPGFVGEDEFEYAAADDTKAGHAVVQVRVIPDLDGDGVEDPQDNCSTAANADQRDTDGDDFGNRCDADLDQNGFVNYTDLSIFRSRFGSSNADADFDGNGIVNFADLSILRSLFGKPPGPSGLLP